MDFGTIATQLGDFGKLATGLVDFLQNFAKMIDTFAGWDTDRTSDKEIVSNTKGIFESSSKKN